MPNIDTNTKHEHQIKPLKSTIKTGTIDTNTTKTH